MLSQQRSFLIPREFSVSNPSLRLLLIPCFFEEDGDDPGLEAGNDVDHEMDPSMRALCERLIPLRPFWRVYTGLVPMDLPHIAALLAGTGNPIYTNDRLNDSTHRQPEILGVEFLHMLISVWRSNSEPRSRIVVVGDQNVIQAIANHATGQKIHWTEDFLDLTIPPARVLALYSSKLSPSPAPQ